MRISSPDGEAAEQSQESTIFMDNRRSSTRPFEFLSNSIDIHIFLKIHLFLFSGIRSANTSNIRWKEETRHGIDTIDMQGLNKILFKR